MYTCEVCEQLLIYGHTGNGINHWHCKTDAHTEFMAEVLVHRCKNNDVALDIFIAQYPEQQRVAVRRVLTGALDSDEEGEG